MNRAPTKHYRPCYMGNDPMPPHPRPTGQVLYFFNARGIPTMATGPNHIRTLIDKPDELPLERVAEVEDFVDFLRYQNQDRRLTQAAAQTEATNFKKVWSNQDDIVASTPRNRSMTLMVDSQQFKDKNGTCSPANHED